MQCILTATKCPVNIQVRVGAWSPTALPAGAVRLRPGQPTLPQIRPAKERNHPVRPARLRSHLPGRATVTRPGTNTAWPATWPSPSAPMPVARSTPIYHVSCASIHVIFSRRRLTCVLTSANERDPLLSSWFRCLVVPAKYFKKLTNTDDLWEVRAQVGNNIFRLLGFLIPKKEIQLAETRKKDYLKRRKKSWVI